MNRTTSTTLFAGILACLCLSTTSALAQDKMRSEPSGQEKIVPTPGSSTATPPMGNKAAAGSSMGSDSHTGMGANGMGMKHDAKSIDSNGDGMVSKAEFTKHHEAMWASMKKNAKGQIAVSDFDSQLMAK